MRKKGFGDSKFTDHPLYITYTQIKQRCYNPNATNYKWYGGKGITLAKRWIESFANFVEDMPGYKKGLSLDRKDSTKNYDKDNCRWVPRSFQRTNQSRNSAIEYNGKVQTLAEWAKELNISRYAVKKKFNYVANKNYWPKK